MHYDIFNGDADGICALLQLRLAEPKESELITGVKRDINLLSKVTVKSGDSLTVLDVSLDKNRDGLVSALDAGAEVFYVDHHYAGDIPESEKLTTIINPAPDVCTALLVNQHLNYAYVNWAVTGAFGDNLNDSAMRVAKKAELSEEELASLKDLGIYLNYNGYGASLDDLHYTPAELFKTLLNYACPLDFIRDSDGIFSALEAGYKEDMHKASTSPYLLETASTVVLELPNEAWARRVSGVYGNALANEHPARGHAVLTHKANGNYLVSVRAPLENKTGADEFCRGFETGGGRAAAAGINDLPAEQLEDFLKRFEAFYS